MTRRRPPPLPSRARDDAKTNLALQAGTVIAGKVRLEHLLTRGGMGSVWRAYHLSLEVPVAVKFLQHAWAAADDTLTRFGREAKAAAQIRSSNVVQVLDHGVDRGSPYIIMELLEGEDLAMRLRRERRLALTEVSFIVRNIARGLQIAHDAGLVHRDLKPQNIFLAVEGDAIVPKILDFGIAKQLPRTSMPAGSDTRDGQLLGTPYYMSPEQARGRPNVDHRADLWALGVTAYRALVGRKPFEAEVIGDVIVQICSDPIPNASTLAPELPPAIDDFFAKALARPPDERFQSARDLAVALDAVAGGVGATPGERPARPAAPPHHPASLHPTPPSMGGMHHTPPSLHASWGDTETLARQTASRRAWLIIGGGALAVVALMSWAIGRLSAMDESADRPTPAAESPEAAIETRPPDPRDDESDEDEAESENEQTSPGPELSTSASAGTSATSVEPRPTVPPQPRPEPPKPTKKKHRDVGY